MRPNRKHWNPEEAENATNRKRSERPTRSKQREGLARRREDARSSGARKTTHSERPAGKAL